MTEAPTARPPRTPQEASVIRKMIGEPGAGLTGFGEWIQEVGRQNPQFDALLHNTEISGDVARYRGVVVRAMGLPERVGEDETDLAVMRKSLGSAPVIGDESVLGVTLTPVEADLLKNAFQEVIRFVESPDNTNGKGKLADVTQKGATLSLAIDAAAFGLSFSRQAAPLLAKMKTPPKLLDLGMRDYLDIMRNKKWTEAGPANWGSEFKGDKARLEASATLIHRGWGGRSWLNQRIDGYLQAIKPEVKDTINLGVSERNQLGAKLRVEALARILGEDNRIELLGDQEYLGLVRELAGMTGQPDVVVSKGEAVDESPFGKAAESLRQETERLARLGLENRQRLAAISHEVTELRRTINILEHEALMLEQISSPTAQALETLGAVQSKVDGVLADRERIAEVIALRREFFGITPEEAGNMWPHIEDLFRLDPTAISSAAHIEFLLSKIPLFNKVYPKLGPQHTSALSSALNTVQVMLGLEIPIDQARGSLKLVMDSLRSQLGEEAVKAGQVTLDNLKFPADTTNETEVVAAITQALQQSARVKPISP